MVRSLCGGSWPRTLGVLGSVLGDISGTVMINVLCSGMPCLQKSILGLVQGSACRIDVEFKTAQGQAYKRTAPVKAKSGDLEEVPLYTNKDDILGEASKQGALGSSTWRWRWPIACKAQCFCAPGAACVALRPNRRLH